MKNFFSTLVFLSLTPTVYAASPAKLAECERPSNGGDNAGAMDPELSNDILFSSNERCYYHHAKDEKQIKYCKMIPDGILNSKCVTAVAIAKRDFKLCDQVMPNKKEPLLTKMYHNECIASYAGATGDVEVCRTIRKSNSFNHCLQSAEMAKDKASRNQEQK